MAKKNGSTYVSEDLERQSSYARSQLQSKGSLSLIATESFVRGMRDSGYRSTATAIDEFIDNAIQAQADSVDIVLHYAESNTHKKKIDADSGGAIAVIDNGHGMDPDMIRFAVVWGGTHREDDRTGFGRYGFGLPSAAVSISRSYEVYSKVPGGSWHMVRIDLDDIAAGKLRNEDGIAEVPHAVEAALPAWVASVLPKGDLPHGTVIVLDQCDQLTNGYITSSSFKPKVLEHVGLIYRDLLPTRVRMRVIDLADKTEIKEVEPIDPLFTREDARYYADTPLRATPVQGKQFTVKAQGTRTEELGTVRIRYSTMPWGFNKGSKGRMAVRKDNNGFIIKRAGRQIDVVKTNPWFTVMNNDKFWGCEIDFDPTLDEDFGVTVNKQQINLSERMWQLLEDNDVYRAVDQFRTDYESKRPKHEEEEPSTKESEDIAAKTAKYRTRKAIPQPPERERESAELLREEVTRVQRETGKPEEEVRQAIEQAIEAEPFKVNFEDLPGAPFYRMLQVGGQRRLLINTAHRFYTDVYGAPHSDPRVKTALALLLIAMGECEQEASIDTARFYRTERAEWSRRLDIMLEELANRDPLDDAREARDARREAAEESAPM